MMAIIIVIVVIIIIGRTIASFGGVVASLGVGRCYGVCCSGGVAITSSVG
jgi:hypothetical protein